VSGGRPTKVLDPKVATKVLAHMRAGGFVSHAAAKAGVHRDTVLEWVRRGKAEDAGHYHDFALAFAEARAEGCEAHIQAIRDATHGAGNADWKAHAFILSRLDPATFGIESLEKKNLALRNQKLEAEIVALRKGQLPLPGGGVNLTREEFALLFAQRFGQPPGRARVEQIGGAPPADPKPDPAHRNARGEHDAE